MGIVFCILPNYKYDMTLFLIHSEIIIYNINCKFAFLFTILNWFCKSTSPLFFSLQKFTQTALASPTTALPWHSGHLLKNASRRFSTYPPFERLLFRHADDVSNTPLINLRHQLPCYVLKNHPPMTSTWDFCLILNSSKLHLDLYSQPSSLYLTCCGQLLLIFTLIMADLHYLQSSAQYCKFTIFYYISTTYLANLHLLSRWELQIRYPAV